MVSCKLTVAAVLAGLFVGWAIWLASQAALHAACNSDELPAASFRALFNSAGIPAHESCSYTFGWTWYLVFYQFSAIVLAACALCCARAAGLKLGVLAALAVITSLVMPLCNNYVALHYSLPNGTYTNALFITFEVPLTSRACKGAIAGTLIVCVFNVLLCFVLGWQHPENASKQCCQKAAATAGKVEVTAAAAATTATAGPAPIPLGAFIQKTEAASAAMNAV